MKPIITINDLSVSYDRKRVLTNVFADIEPGYIYGVLGPNGAGKSTLFKAILGLLEDYSGRIEVFGKDIREVRRRVSYVPQRSEVDWTFPATVYDIALMGRYPHKKVFERLSPNDHARTCAALEELSILDLRHRQIGELSGGQQQRVFLARALAQEADLLLLDEPFVGVDIPTEEKIINVLRGLAQQGRTLLVVHHDLQSVVDYFDRVLLINQRLVAAGDTATVFSNENIARTYGGQLAILQQTGMLQR